MSGFSCTLFTIVFALICSHFFVRHEDYPLPTNDRSNLAQAKNIHSCCEFMFAMTMSCQENGISQPFALSWSSYILSTSPSLMFPEPYTWWYKSPVQLYTHCLLFPAPRTALSLHSLPFTVKRSFSFPIEAESSIYLWAYAKCLEGKLGDMSIQLYNYSRFLVDPLKHRSLALPSYFCSSLYSIYLPQHPPPRFCACVHAHIRN